MLSVCLVFLYVWLCAYLVGFAVLSGIRYVYGSFMVKADGYVMAGLVTVTVYAQFFSLFHKVGLVANLLLAAVCAVIAVVLRRQLKEEILRQYGALGRGRRIFYLLLFLLMAYGTSRGIIHYDTGLYHAQSIRWIEEYGVVKGLGNLHCRLAYNSSSFALSALYSFGFLGGQSFHCMAGFLALVLAKVCGEIGGAWGRRKLLLPDFARLMGIYYLLMIFDEMVSPASDYFMVLTVFYIIIRYLDLAVKQENSWIPYGLLALLCVFTVSVKLSAAFIVLFALKPAAMLLCNWRKKKNGKGIAGFLGMGFLIVLPFLIRNVWISGWLVYPFTALDVFPVDWKIPEGIAAYDAKEIQVWGRGIYDVAAYGRAFGEWFPAWLGSQSGVDRLFILAGGIALPVAAAGFAVAVWKKNGVQRDVMFAAAAVDVSFLFWLFSAPLIRYGCVYVWLAAPLTFGGLAFWLVGSGKAGRVFWRFVYAAVFLAGGYKAVMFGKEVAAGYSPEYFVWQKDYENFGAQAYEVGGITFYCPVEGDRIGYEAFPSSPARADMELRGDGLEDGFRYKQ